MRGERRSATRRKGKRKKGKAEERRARGRKGNKESRVPEAEWGERGAPLGGRRCSEQHGRFAVNSAHNTRTQQKVKGYLGFRVVVVKVVEGAVVGVVGFVQQLDGQRPAEGLGHERVLGTERQRDKDVYIIIIIIIIK